jgi:hypothetical protein
MGHGPDRASDDNRALAGFAVMAGCCSGTCSGLTNITGPRP